VFVLIAVMARIRGSILLVAEVTGNLALFYLSALLLGLAPPLSLVLAAAVYLPKHGRLTDNYVPYCIGPTSCQSDRYLRYPVPLLGPPAGARHRYTYHTAVSSRFGSCARRRGSAVC
jgi:hypothetical protein